MGPRGDPRVAAIVCRDDPVLCAEAWGVELAAGVAVWHAFRAADEFREGVCRALGWTMEVGVCVDPEPHRLYPLAVTHAMVTHVLGGVRATREAETLVRLYLSAPPPATTLLYADLGYVVGWAALASTVPGVDSASAGGGVPAAIRTVYIIAAGCSAGAVAERREVHSEEDAVALAAPLAHPEWRAAVARVAKSVGLPVVHLHNTGGQVLEVIPAKVKTMIYAEGGRESLSGATAEEVKAVWSGAARSAEDLLRAKTG